MVTQADEGYTMELACCEMVIENEIAQGCSQKDIAATYAMAIVSSWPTEWSRVHDAIVKRWSKSAIERIKTMAWAEVERRGAMPRAARAARERAQAHSND